MKRLFSTLLLLAVVFSSFVQAQTPSEAATASPQLAVSNLSNGSQVWNFENADIKTVINAVSKQTGKNFIVDPRVQGKVTLISSTPLDKNELYEVFLTLLQTYGYLVVPDGSNVFKVVPDSIAKYQEVPAYTQNGGNNISGNAVMVKVIPVRNGSADQFVNLLRPLLPNSSEISSYKATNTLIISSTASKIGEIEKIIGALDTPNPGTIEIVPLHYAKASDIATAIKSMLPQSLPGGTPTLITADNSSNSILISGSTQERANIRSLVRRMDMLTVDSAKSNSTVVVNLHYLNAKDFAPILQNVAASMSGEAVSNVGSSTSSNTPSSSDNNSGGDYTLSNIRGLYADAVKSSSSNTATSSAVSSGTGESGVHVQAEPATNSLIIDGSPAQIHALKTVIGRLDIEPKQVLVEALIAEVDESTMQQLGIQWGTIPSSNSNFTNLNGGSSADNSGGNTTGNNVPPFDNGFSAIAGGLGVGIVNAGRIRALIAAIKNDSATNILSTPSMVVLDNEQAEIKVGQKVSTSAGSYQNLAGGGGIVNQSQYQDVALTLQVTPQINQNGTIRLKLKHQNDALTSQVGVNGNPTINDSQFSTNVMVDSGQILVIGGLISNDTENNVQKVPLLGSVPLLGRLFQYHNDTVTKKNLVIFLRPTVLGNRAIADEQTLSRYSVVRGMQLNRQSTEDLLSPKGGNTVLPHWPSTPIPEPFPQHSHA